jgi:hypothetical protein
MKSLEGDRLPSIKKKKENRFAGFTMLSPLLILSVRQPAVHLK